MTRSRPAWWGVYTLERIAQESEREYWPIMETLTAFIRERAPRLRQAVINPFVELQSGSAKEAEPVSVEVRPATDSQAVLTVLGPP